MFEKHIMYLYSVPCIYSTNNRCGVWSLWYGMWHIVLHFRVMYTTRRQVAELSLLSSFPTFGKKVVVAR